MIHALEFVVLKRRKILLQHGGNDVDLYVGPTSVESGSNIRLVAKKDTPLKIQEYDTQLHAAEIVLMDHDVGIRWF